MAFTKTINDAHLELAYRLGESAVPTDTTELARRLNWFKTAINNVCGGDEPMWFTEVSPLQGTAGNDVTVADQQDYALPTRFRKIKQLKIDGYKYEEIPLEEVFEKFETPNSVVPILPAFLARSFYIDDERLFVIPIPSDAPTALTVSSITESAGVATATTSAAHGLKRNQVVKFAGTTPAAYNAQFRILTVPSTTTFTFAITSGTGAASVVGTVSEQNIQIWYYEYPAEATSTSSAIILPDEFMDLIVSYAEARYWSMAHKRAKAGDAFVEYEARLAAIKREDFRRKFRAT